MKKTLKNLVLGVTLIGALSLFGCSDNQKIPSYSHNGVFNGYPVEIGVKDNQRYVRISETTFGTRGYKPAQLIARDADSKFGFEDVQLSAAYDIVTGIDSSKINALERFNDPTELERIFAYVSADREKSQRRLLTIQY